MPAGYNRISRRDPRNSVKPITAHEAFSLKHGHKTTGNTTWHFLTAQNLHWNYYRRPHHVSARGSNHLTSHIFKSVNIYHKTRKIFADGKSRELLGVSNQTIRRWPARGKIQEVHTQPIDAYGLRRQTDYGDYGNRSQTTRVSSAQQTADENKRIMGTTRWACFKNSHPGSMKAASHWSCIVCKKTVIADSGLAFARVTPLRQGNATPRLLDSKFLLIQNIVRSKGWPRGPSYPT